jgi:hypothetical protein
MNYFVPNFGRDRDVKATDLSLAWAEKSRNHVWNYKKPEKKKEDNDFRVPDFGLDQDVIWTDQNIKREETRLKHEWKPEQDENGVWVVPEPFDNKSYTYKPVANVQLDSEVESDPICSSAGCPERKTKAPDGHPINYFVPNFGRDTHIKETDASLEWAQRNLNHVWKYDANKKKEKGPPMNYPVPNFGVDHDIITTQNNIQAQEKRLNHKWVPVQDENGSWEVPEPINNKSYTYRSLAQLPEEENLVEVQSDPICSSAGCNYASEKGKKTHPMNYFVPNFGRDRDIKATDLSLAWAERSLNRTWNYKPKKEEKKNTDFRIPDFGLDEDIVDTQSNIANAQKKLQHDWQPEQDENGVWVVP